MNGGPQLDFAFDRMPDLHRIVAERRSSQPVAEVRWFGERAWLLTRHADVTAAFRDERAFPSAAAYSLFAEPVQGRTLQCMAGDEHRRNRALVSPAFRPGSIATYADGLIRPVVHELVDGLVEGLPRGGPVDLVADFTRKLPFTVITGLLGIPADAQGRFQRWADALFSFPADPDGALAASAEFTRYLEPLIAERRRGPGDDVISALATAEVESERLTDDEICSFVRLLFPAGADTTYLALGSLFLALLTHPDARERAGEDANFRRRAVDEALRWEPPVAIQPRRSVEPTTWGAVEIPADAWVLFGIAAANRDPEVFADPDRFDPDRDGTGAILTFGNGPHYCLGAHLAREELAIAAEVVLERLPGLRLVDPAGVVVEGAVLRGPKALIVTGRGAPAAP